MSMPEKVWLDPYDGLHSLKDDGVEYVRADLVAEKDAEIERLREALEQAVDAGSLDIVTVVKDKSYGMWRYEGVECIVGQSSTENFFAGHIEDNDELAAYLRERDSRPPTGGVQNGVQGEQGNEGTA